MQYKGKELIEMLPENWDGKSREMIVWTNVSNPAYKDVYHIKTVIGYNPRKLAWVVDDKGLVYWPHCAEIPANEEEDVMKLLIDNENEILELKAENKVLKAKLESFGELHKIAEFVQNTILESKSEKKVRRMTYRELAKWISNGNGEWAFSEKCDNNVSIHSLDFVYYACDENKPVSDKYKIRGWDETEWHEPLIEESRFFS